MPLGAARLTLLAKSSVTAVAEVIRKKVGFSAQEQVQVSTAQSKFGGASALFDGGTDDYILVDHTAQNITYGDDFTYECWINFNALPSVFAMLNTGSTRGDYLAIYLKSGVWTIAAAISDGSTSTTQIRNLGFTPVTGTWYHVAFVKEGSAVRFYVDGTEKTTDNGSAGTVTADKGWDGVRRIGDWQNTGSNYAFNGYIDEVRFSKTVRYTSGFTPSTTPFTNDDNTHFLIHMNGTNGSTFFEDDNGVGRSPVGLTAIGNAQVDTAQSQFGSASSIYDGTGDYMTTSLNTPIATGDFTIEGWVRSASTDNHGMFHLNTSLLPGSTTGIAIAPRSGSNGWTVYLGSGTSFNTNIGCTQDTWHHVAVVRSSGTSYVYIDGALLRSQADTTDYSSYTELAIGAYYSTSFTLNGYIDEFRISNTARYTSGFTPSTTPFTNDTNTLLLLHMDGTDGSTVFRDDNGTGRSAVGWTANGNVQIDTAQSKFGGTSASFDGTGDYLTTSNVTSLSPSDDFTFECWYYITAFPTTVGDRFTLGAANGYIQIEYEASGDYDFSAALETAGGSVHYVRFNIADTSLSTWHHLAFVKSGSNYYCFQNGTQCSVAATAGSSFTSSHGWTKTTSDQYIGRLPGSTINDMDGYIDEARLSNTARYTAGFTALTEPFQNDDNTLLLLHMDGTDGSTTFIDDNGVTTAGTGA